MARKFKPILFQPPSQLEGSEGPLQKSSFSFERRLGIGAFGDVWKVKYKISSIFYALKQVPKEKVANMIP